MKKTKTNYLFVGLGNPGAEYENSRHSVGRMALLALQKKFTRPSGGPIGEMEVKDWRDDKKLKAELCDGKLGSNKFRLLIPNNFMNNSGGSVKPLVKTKAEAKDVVVIHDDVDLALGTIKISYNRGSGGHKGVDSIVKALKTNEFTRIRVGLSPSTPSGKTKKPSSDKVVDFVIGNFKPAEQDELKKVIKKVKEIIASLIENGLDRTMNSFN